MRVCVKVERVTLKPQKLAIVEQQSLLVMINKNLINFLKSLKQIFYNDIMRSPHDNNQENGMSI